MTFEEFYNSKDIRKIITTVVKKYVAYEEHDELYQVASIGAWLAFKKYNGTDSKLTTYVYNYVNWNILRHLRNVKKAWRCEAKGVSVTVNSEIVQDRLLQMGVEDDYTNTDTQAVIKHVESKLNDKQKVGFKYMLNNYNNSEIGRLLGYSPDGIRMWRYKIRKEILKYDQLKAISR